MYRSRILILLRIVFVLGMTKETRLGPKRLRWPMCVVLAVCRKALTMTQSFVAVDLLLLFSLFLQPTCCLDDGSGVIRLAPVSQVAALGSNASFSCHGVGDTFWFINGVPLGYQNQEDFKLRGFIANPNSDRGSEVNIISMNVLASVQNNNTNISCLAAGTGQGDRSENATLTVAGVPSTPRPKVSIRNTTTLEITWERPFTMELYAVHNYSLIVVNSSSGAVVMQRDIVAANETVYIEYFNTEHLVQDCLQFQINVSAVNAVGTSDFGTTAGGFPVSPDKLEDVESEVTFQSDGTPRVEIRFTFPHICSYQAATYRVTVSQLSDNVTRTVGPLNYLERDETQLKVTIQEGLRSNQIYTATVIVETIAATVNNSVTFNTTITLPRAELPSPLPPATGAVNPSSASRSNMMVVIGGVAGASIFLLFAALCVVVACCIIFRRMKARKAQTGDDGVDTARKACSSLIPNPIYTAEGPVYEEIAGQKQLRPLPRLPHARDSGYVDIPLRISAHVKLTPETDTATQKKRAYENVDLKVPTPSEDAYTVMNPVGTIRSTQQREEREGEQEGEHERCNNLPNDVNHYVIS